MNVVFLDIDDTMTNEGFPVRSPEHQGFAFDPKSVRLLKNLLDKTDAKIVVTSSLRQGETVESMNNEFFRHYELDKYVVGLTPYLGKNYGHRGEEIQAYIDLVKGTDRQVDNFVILDDDNDMNHLMDRLIQCKRGLCGGLDERVKSKALVMLSKPLPNPLQTLDEYMLPSGFSLDINARNYINRLSTGYPANGTFVSKLVFTILSLATDSEDSAIFNTKYRQLLQTVNMYENMAQLLLEKVGMLPNVTLVNEPDDL